MAAGLIISVRSYKKDRSISYLLLAAYFLSPFLYWSVCKIFGAMTPLPSDGHIVVKVYSRLAIPETILVLGIALLSRNKSKG